MKLNNYKRKENHLPLFLGSGNGKTELFGIPEKESKNNISFITFIIILHKIYLFFKRRWNIFSCCAAFIFVVAVLQSK